MPRPTLDRAPATLSRRESIRLSASLSAAALAGAVIRPRRAAAQTPNTAHTVIVFRPSHAENGAVVTEAYTAALEPFRSKNPSLAVQFDWAASTWAGDTSAIAEAILGASAPDLFAAWRFAPLASGGYLLDLHPYLRASNFPLSIFPSTLVQSFAHQGHQHGLPVYNEWAASMVNLSMIDRAGLSYPSPHWDYLEAARLYRSLARPDANPAKSVYGGMFMLYYSNIPDAMDLAPWGASLVMPGDSARAGLDTAEMVAAVTYMSDLVNSKAALPSFTGWNHFRQQRLGVGLITDFLLPIMAQAADTLGFAYDFWPLPSGPRGGATYCSREYYTIPSSCREPDAAWALLEYVASTPRVARVPMTFWLYPPALLSMSDEYLGTIRQIAPPLRNKNISAFTYWQDHAFQPLFQYENEQALVIINDYFGRIWSQQSQPAAALSAAARQVNALEATGARLQTQVTAQASLVQRLQTATRPVALPPPPVAGAGVPATRAPGLMVASHAQGLYTLLGDGSAISAKSDNCLYACAPTSGSVGTFTCRLVAIADVDCPQLSPSSQIGLMARADLSDDAVMLFLAVSGGNGVAWEERPGVGLDEAGVGGSGPGLLAASAVTANPAKAAPNYLRKPVWLRLQRRQETWAGYTSWDGRTWMPVGAPAVLRAGSMWIGLAASAHNADFGGKGYIRAVFDHVSFVPSAAYQIGASGVPPAAGAVPAGWATAARAG